MKPTHFRLRAAMLLIGAATAWSCRPGSVPLPRVDPDRHPAAAHPEPSLPPVLIVQPSRTDPELFDVKVVPHFQGTAQVGVRADRPVRWESADAILPKRMTRGDATQILKLRVPASAASGMGLAAAAPGVSKNQSPGVIVDLTIRDADGNVVLTISEPVPVSDPAAPASVHSPRVHTAKDANGNPLIVTVPADAPAPIVGEAQP